MSRCRMVFSGSGGQGIITAAIIYAEAATVYDGKSAVQSQSYGPEARGGSSRSDVIISESRVRFPKVVQPDVLVCLSQDAYNKYARQILPGGLLVIDPWFVTPERKVDAVQAALPMYGNVSEKLKKTVVFNICMLGAVTEMVGMVREESVRKVVWERVPPAFADLNLKAFDMGLDLARAQNARWRKSQ